MALGTWSVGTQITESGRAHNHIKWNICHHSNDTSNHIGTAYVIRSSAIRIWCVNEEETVFKTTTDDASDIDKNTTLSLGLWSVSVTSTILFVCNN